MARRGQDLFELVGSVGPECAELDPGPLEPSSGAFRVLLRADPQRLDHGRLRLRRFAGLDAGEPRRELVGDGAEHRGEQCLPLVRARDRHRHEVGADEHVRDGIEFAEQPRHPRLVRRHRGRGRGVVRAAGPGVDRRSGESDRARARRRLGHDHPVEQCSEVGAGAGVVAIGRRRLIGAGVVCHAQPEAAVVPAPAQRETWLEVRVADPDAGTDGIGEGVVVGRGPGLIGEVALQRLLDGSERLQRETAHDAGQRAHGLRGQPLLDDAGPGRVEIGTEARHTPEINRRPATARSTRASGS